MNSPRTKPSFRLISPAFSLVEMIVVIAVLVILLTVGASLFNSTGPQARRSAADQLTALVEQARTTAITSRCHVILAVAEPGDLANTDERCRVGLFKVANWPEDPSAGAVDGELVGRWRTLDSGVILIGGQVDGIENPLDAPEWTINHSLRGKPQQVKAHALVFHSRGGLRYPAGSAPVALRVAEGGYRGGKAVPNRRVDSAAIAENRLKIGRVTARPYRIDG